jgi:hypothetical protein
MHYSVEEQNDKTPQAEADVPRTPEEAEEARWAAEGVPPQPPDDDIDDEGAGEPPDAERAARSAYDRFSREFDPVYDHVAQKYDPVSAAPWGFAAATPGCEVLGFLLRVGGKYADAAGVFCFHPGGVVSLCLDGDRAKLDALLAWWHWREVITTYPDTDGCIRLRVNLPALSAVRERVAKAIAVTVKRVVKRAIDGDGGDAVN